MCLEPQALARWWLECNLELAATAVLPPPRRRIAADACSFGASAGRPVAVARTPTSTVAIVVRMINVSSHNVEDQTSRVNCCAK